MKLADRVRTYCGQKYVEEARRLGMEFFSIRAGDVVRELGLSARVPAVCSALRSRQFLEENNLRLTGIPSGPPSGQSTTVIFKYEFTSAVLPASSTGTHWEQLRGALREEFARLGGSEAYLRGERSHFYGPREQK